MTTGRRPRRPIRRRGARDTRPATLRASQADSGRSAAADDGTWPMPGRDSGRRPRPTCRAGGGSVHRLRAGGTAQGDRSLSFARVARCDDRRRDWTRQPGRLGARRAASAESALGHNAADRDRLIADAALRVRAEVGQSTMVETFSAGGHGGTGPSYASEYSGASHACAIGRALQLRVQPIRPHPTRARSCRPSRARRDHRPRDPRRLRRPTSRAPARGPSRPSRWRAGHRGPA